jgi:hypothetical protein
MKVEGVEWSDNNNDILVDLRRYECEVILVETSGVTPTRSVTVGSERIPLLRMNNNNRTRSDREDQEKQKEGKRGEE